MTTFTIAANQGEIGGGEVMLLALAEAARTLGHDVHVVGPATPSQLVDAARRRGFRTTAIPGRGTRQYLMHLRRWDARERTGLLWCNGLRPALATALRRNRVVHLHQEPVGRLAVFARVARFNSLATVVPSNFMAGRVPGSIPLSNWTEDVPGAGSVERSEPVTLGYLGRLSSDKGVPVLCEAVQTLVAQGRDVRLLLAGEARFVAPADADRVDQALAGLGDRVVRRGWMNRDDFFAAVDLAVFPSVWQEPFGLVAAEAMAARCPFVVTRAGALPEVAGLAYPFVAEPDDAASLAAVIAAALEAEWPAVLESSRTRWEMSFSPAAGTQRLAHLLDTLKLSERSRA